MKLSFQIFLSVDTKDTSKDVLLNKMNIIGLFCVTQYTCLDSVINGRKPNQINLETGFVLGPKSK